MMYLCTYVGCDCLAGRVRLTGFYVGWVEINLIREMWDILQSYAANCIIRYYIPSKQN